MIAAWMLFALEISALLFAAAWIAERALLSSRRPVRGVWVAAMVGANFLPILLSRIAFDSDITSKWALPVPPNSVLAQIGAPLLVLWALAAAVGVFVCAAAVWRMARTRPSWRNAHVNDVPVLVSHDIGPALVGVLHYSIVVPQWAYSLEARARSLLLVHEREHARHYDPLLLAAAVLAVVVAPWNVFNWLFLKRLHLAVELDCDQRVLRVHSDARTYAALLLDVAERVLPSVIPAAAFVEHGASLETRINVMSERPKSHPSLRLSAGLGASLLLAAGACVMPRPYAIIIVPQTVAAATVAPAQSAVLPTQLAPAVFAPAPEATSAPSGSASQKPGGSDGILPVPPSLRVAALDDAFRSKVFLAVVAAAPRALGAWARRDSALILLFDDHGRLLKQTVVGASRVNRSIDASYVFSQTFMLPEIGAMKSAAITTITHGVNNETLDFPLSVYSGHLPDGAPIPLTRAEILPTRESMVASLRAKYPELLKDTAQNSTTYGALLFDAKGMLMETAVVSMASPPAAEGASHNPADREVVRNAFGKSMDNLFVVESGLINLSNSSSFSVGPSKLVYAVVIPNEDLQGYYTQMKSIMPDLPMSGASSSRAGVVFDLRMMDARLAGLVQSRVPDAYGDWSRSDSAVVFLFDSNDQLIARKTSKLPEEQQFLYLQELISRHMREPHPEDIITVGASKFTSTTGGRVLDKPLIVIWGRLSPEATASRKR